ncbi:MAG: hypothetical protein Tsb0010_17300 [Parvularculaceae bacterium]
MHNRGAGAWRRAFEFAAAALLIAGAAIAAAATLILLPILLAASAAAGFMEQYAFAGQKPAAAGGAGRAPRGWIAHRATRHRLRRQAKNEK